MKLSQDCLCRGCATGVVIFEINHGDSVLPVKNILAIHGQCESGYYDLRTGLIVDEIIKPGCLIIGSTRLGIDFSNHFYNVLGVRVGRRFKTSL